jgi:hypothetical protein
MVIVLKRVSFPKTALEIVVGPFSYHDAEEVSESLQRPLAGLG